jgi:hypothetical protein
MKKSELKQLIREVIQESSKKHEVEYHRAFRVKNYEAVKKLFDTLLKKKMLYSVYFPTRSQIVDRPEIFNSRVGEEGWFDVIFTTSSSDLKMWGPTDIGELCSKNGIDSE